MAKNKIQISLAFSAETDKVKNQIKDLEQQLNQFFHSTTSSDLPITKSLSKAQDQAIKLTAALKDAVNVNTGKFDLSKFQTSLKRAGTDLQQLRDSLVKAGPEGVNAFMSLANTIVAAEIPTKRINEHLAKMAKTLKDTARWQLSSNIMHGLQSALQSAYGYAQDLNKSLNDIRIVTGYNTEYMEKFAKSANKSAKALSTTTNEYTKASLIYFQQGLSDEEVNRRTEATIKMANVTGEAAEDVSSYMTAIWNNFDDGSESLTHYADVVTALGAATAASSEEIAEGLQKFSAVANTVGLSYEYASTALATVVSQTRESPDTVGTAFKTIFARLESLSLGETLDDNTTLTKYSQALATVGVDIKESNGSLKDMDTILDELGSKWKQISQDQQVALAQTVAGMRQYNNFIALLDNYDTFKINLEVAQGSTGTIDEQAAIYAESWEAAADRVTASLETIYEKILDDDFFIKALDTFAKFLDFFDDFIEGAGGLQGVLSTIATILLRAFGQQAAKGLENMVYNLKSVVGLTKKEALTTKEQVAQMAGDIPSSTGEYNERAAAENDILKDSIALQMEYNKNQDRMTQGAKAEYEIQRQINELLAQRRLEAAGNLDTAQNEYDDIALSISKESLVAGGDYQAATAEISENEKNINTILTRYNELVSNYLDNSTDAAEEAFLNHITTLVEEIKEQFGEDSVLIATVKEEALKITQKDKPKATGEDKKKKEFRNEAKKSIESSGVKEVVVEEQFAKKAKISTERTKELFDAKKKVTTATKENTTATKNYTENLDKTNKKIKEGATGTKDYYKAFIDVSTVISSVTAIFSSISSTWEVLSDPDISGWEKFSTILGTIGAILPSLIMGYQSLNSLINLSNVWTAIRNGLSLTEIKLSSTEIELQKAKNAEEQKAILIQKLNLTGDQAELVITKMKEGVTLKEALASVINTKAKQEETKAIWGEVAAKIASYMASLPLLAVILMIIAAIAVLSLVIWGVVNAFKGMQANSPEGQLKAAKEEAQAMAEALDEAKSRANEIKEAFDEYDTVKDRLAECVKGTEEWNEALQENNAKVIELIQKYPELVNAVSRGLNGELIIDEQAMEEALNKANQTVITATTASYSANANVRDKQIVVDRENLSDRLLDTSIEKGAGLDYISGSIANNTELFVNKTKDEIIDILKTDSSLGASGYSDATIEKWADTIYLNNDKLKELQDSIDANTIQSRAETDAIKMQLLSDNKIVQDSKYVDQIVEATSQDDDEQLNARIDAEMKKLDADRGGAGWGKEGINQADAANEEAKKIWKEYAAAAGLERVELTDTTGNDNNREFVFKKWDEEQKKYIEDSVDLETMKRTVAAANVNEDIVKEAEDLTLIYNKMDKLGAGMLTAASSGNTSYLTRTQLEKIESGNIKPEDLNLSTEDLKTLGYDSMTAFTDAVTKAARLANDAWETTLSSMTSRTQEVLTATLNNWGENESFANLTDTQLKAYGNKLDELYKNNGAAAQESFSTVMDELMTKNKDRADEIVQIAAGIDWTNGEQGLVDLYNQLDDIGIQVDKTSQSWLNFVMAIDNAPKALIEYDFSTVRKEIADIKELVDDISFGDIITDEDFEKIRKYSTEMKDLFILTADGYRFIGDEQELQNLSLEQSQKTLQESLNNNKEALTLVDKLDDWVGGSQRDYDYLAHTTEDDLVRMRANSLVGDQSITDEDLAKLGWYGGKELLQEYSEKAHNGDEAAQAELQAFMGKIAELQNQVEAGDFATDKDYELYASRFDSIDELNEKYKQYLAEQGLWNEEEGLRNEQAEAAYQKQINYLKVAEDERIKSIDLYQDEAKALEKIERELDKVANKKDKAYGTSKLSLIDEEIALTDKLLSKNKDLLAVAEKNVTDSKNELTAFAGTNAKFDENGNLINREELLKTYANDESDYARIQELINSYDEAIDKSNEYTDAIEENELALKDLGLEKIEYELNFTLEVNDQALEKVEWQLEHLENKAYSVAEAVALIGKKINISSSNLNAYTDTILSIAQKKGIDTTDMSLEQVIDALQAKGMTNDEYTIFNEAISGIYSSTDELYAANKEMADSFFSYFQDIYDNYDKVAQKADELTSATQHYQDIIDIVGTGMTGISKEFLTELTRTEQYAAQTRLKASKQALDQLTADKITAEQQLEKALADGDEEMVKYWEDTLDNIDGLITDTQDEMHAAWTDALSAAADSFAQEIETILSNFEQQMSGAYGTLERLSEAFEQQSTLNKQYVSDYEKIYKLSKLTRQIEGSMNNTSSIKAKSTLADLQREITALQESGKELSEYDLEYLNKKYELKQAEIALEETQANNRTMRLTQDANGNWGYTYIANEDATASAQQDYEDKLFALQEYSSQYLEENGSLIIQLQQEYSDAILAIYSDSTLTEQEINDRAAQITEYYTERMRYATEEYDKAIQNNALLYNQDWQTYSESTGYKISSNQDFATSFETSILGTLTDAFGETGSATKLLNNFTNLIGEAPDEEGKGGSGILGGLATAYSGYENTIKNIMNEAGVPLSELQPAIRDALWGEDGSPENPTGGLGKELSDSEKDFQNFIDYITGKDQKDYEGDTLLTSYLTKIGKELDALKDKLGETRGYINDIETALSDAPYMEKGAAAFNALLGTYDPDIVTKYFSKGEDESAEAWYERVKNADTTALTRVSEYKKGERDVYKLINEDRSEKNYATLEEYSAHVEGLEETARLYDQLKNSTGGHNYLDQAINVRNGESTEEYKARIKDFSNAGIASSLEELRNKGNEFHKTYNMPLEQFMKDLTYDPSKGDNLQKYKDRLGNLNYALIQMKNAIEYLAGFGYETKDILATSPLPSNQDYEQWYMSFADYVYKQTSTNPLRSFNGGGGGGVGKFAVAVDLYDTGGYTGSWGPDGRLAMLHQKEIVLNADDTTNFLAGIDILRDIVKTIDLQAAAARGGLGSFTARTIDNQSQTIQQEVTIHAEFPNATDRNEIEEAFNSLMTRTSQFILTDK